MKTEKLHLVQLQKALIPVSKMVIKFGLQCQEFKTNIQKAYIKAAIELLKESKISPTNQAISVKTGIDRRFIAEFKNNPNQQKEALNKMDLVIMALQQARKKSKKLTQANLTSMIDNIYGNHIRAKAVITELIANQILIKQQNKYLIAQTLNEQLQQQADLAEEVDITTKRLFQTFYKKMFETGEKQNLNQSTVFSSKIPHSKHEIVNQLINNKMQDFQQEMHNLIKQHEANVPEGTYSNIGFTQFQFDSTE